MDNISDKLYTGAVWYGKIQTIGLVIVGIIGIGLLLYSIKLLCTDESNWIPVNVVINKIDSNDNKKCNSNTITKITRYSTTTSANYNCIIYFNYNNRNISKQILDSSINYSINDTITVYYDKNNPTHDPQINMIFLSKYWWIFSIVGIIMMCIGFITTYLILSNDNAAAVYGTSSVIDNIFNTNSF